MNRPESEREKRGWRWMLAIPLLALPLIVMPLGCGTSESPWKGETGSPRIVVTTPPLYSFVRGVAGDRPAIKCLCTTTGPHNYDMDHRTARVFDEADLVLAVGLQLDDSFTDALFSMSRRHDLPYIKLGKRLPTSMVKKMRPHKHEEKPRGEEGGHHHHHGEFDPHVWLGIEESIHMIGVIRDELSKIDKNHESEYAKNADAYIARLRKLHADGRKLLADKKLKRIISFHDAFEYFAGAFELEIAGVIEIAPGDNPSAGHLARLEELFNQNPIGSITVEPQFPNSNAAVQLQKSLKNRKPPIEVELVSIDPLETADPVELKAEGAGWYETRMRKNLEALAKVLK